MRLAVQEAAATGPHANRERFLVFGLVSSTRSTTIKVVDLLVCLKSGPTWGRNFRGGSVASFVALRGFCPGLMAFKSEHVENSAKNGFFCVPSAE